jgi:hypothetical protein
MSRNHFKISKGVSLSPVTAQPSDPENGDIIYNSTTTRFEKYEAGSWSTLGSGANQTLSNLTSPTTINQNLNADSFTLATSRSIGDLIPFLRVGALRYSNPGIVYTMTGDFTSGSNQITNVTGTLPTFQTASYYSVYVQGVTNFFTITTFNSATLLTMSANALATSTGVAFYLVAPYLARSDDVTVAGQQSGLFGMRSGNVTTGISGPVSLVSGNATGAAGVSGTVFSGSGSTTTGTSGTNSMRTGISSGGGNSGAIFSVTGSVTTGVSGDQSLFTGNASGTAGISGGINVTSGSATTGVSGNTSVGTGSTTTSVSGSTTLRTGNSSSGGASGSLTVISGTTTSATSGQISISTGVSSASNSGQINVSSGSITTGNSGSISINSGNSTSGGTSGSVNIQSGITTTAASGNATLATGDSTSGSTGSIFLNVGTTSGTKGIVSTNTSINMNSNKITAVADPTTSQEVATKNYVDTRVIQVVGNLPSGQSIPSSMATTVLFSESSDVGNIYNPSTGEAVMPRNGILHITSYVTFQSGAAADTCNVALHINGTAVAVSPSQAFTISVATPFFGCYPLVASIPVLTSDVITIRTTQYAATARILNDGNLGLRLE